MQFTLASLLLAFVVVAMSLAVFGPGGCVVGPLLVAVIAYIRSAKSMKRAMLNVALFTVAGTCLIGLCLPMYSHAGPKEYRIACQNNLRCIGTALWNYQNKHGSYPPASVDDKSGKPIHSWRVLILPQIEELPTYQQYDFGEPWDGPKNKTLLRPIILFQCPYQRRLGTTVTNYLAITGSNTPWGRSWPDLPRSGEGVARNPAIVAEVTGSGIPWMEPRDLTFAEAAAGINGKSGMGIRSTHVLPSSFLFQEYAGAHVLFADGSVRFVPADIPADRLEAVLAGDPKEIERLDAFVERASHRIYGPNIASLTGLVIAVAVMLFRPRRKPVAVGGDTSSPDDRRLPPSTSGRGIG